MPPHMALKSYNACMHTPLTETPMRAYVYSYHPPKQANTKAVHIDHGHHISMAILIFYTMHVTAQFNLIAIVHSPFEGLTGMICGVASDAGIVRTRDKEGESGSW